MRSNNASIPLAEKKAKSDIAPLEKVDPEEMQIRHRDGMLARKLERGARLSLDFCNEILAMPMPEVYHKQYPTIMRAKTAASQTVLMMVAKTDENQLRRAQNTELSQLLKRVMEEEKRIPLLELSAQVTIPDEAA